MSLKILALSLLVLMVVAQHEEAQEYYDEEYQPSAIDLELDNYANANLTYDHLQTYNFLVSNPADFLINVESPHKIKGNLRVYHNQDDVFVETSEEVGEQTQIVIYENMNRVIFNNAFHHAASFSFDARPKQQYVLRIIRNGKDKLVVMNMENYIEEGKTLFNVASDHVGIHEAKTDKIRDELKGYLNVIETHSIMSQQIASHVKNHTQRYMLYQLLELLLIVVASVGQVKVIQKLLSNSDNVI